MAEKITFLLIFVLLLTSGCQSPSIDTNAEVVTIEAEVVAIEVDAEQVINSDIIGVGWYFGPEWIPDNEVHRQQFFDYFEAAEIPFLRLIFAYFEWEDPNNDDDDPWTSPKEFLYNPNFDGFVWNEGGAEPNERLIYLLDYCEENDIWVELNNWESDLKTWIRPEFYADVNSYPIDYNDYLADAEEFGENIAALIYYLKTEANNGKGYDCIKYYAVWNEPSGGHLDYDLAHVDFPGCVNLLNKQVYDHLAYYDQQMGTDVLNQIECIGLEAYPFWRNSPASGHPSETWSEMVGKGIIQYLEEPDGLPGEITDWPDGDPYMDYISIHDYWSVFDYDANYPLQKDFQPRPLQKRLLDEVVKPTVQQIAQYDIDGQIEPVFLGDLGAFAYCWCVTEPASYKHSLYIAEATLRALQIEGITSIVRWAWNSHIGYAAVSYPGCWYKSEPFDKVHVIDENYYPNLLLTKYLKRHSDVLYTKVTGGADASYDYEDWAVEAQRVWAGAFKTPTGPMTLLVVNDSYLPKNITIDFGEKIAGTIDKFYVTSQAYNRISTDRLKRQNGKFTDILPAQSIVVYVERN